MAAYITRRSAICVAAGGATLAFGKARAEGMAGRVVYPVALPTYQSQFVAHGRGFFKDAGLDVQMIQGGNGVKMREIVASGQGDIGIGDITHSMQLTNHGRASRVLMSVDIRNNSLLFIIRKDLAEQGINSLESFAAWKRPDGKKPFLGVSSIGGTVHLWASYYMELLKLKEAVTWLGVGNVDTMLGALKSKQIDVLVSTPSMERDSDQHGWGKLLFDGSSAENWNKTIGGNVPVTAHFALLSSIQKDPAKIQAFTTALWRATQWIKTHSVDDIYGAIEPFVGSTSRDANVFEIGIMKGITDYDGTIDPASFARGEKVWFSELTGIKPQTLADVFASDFVRVAREKYPG